MKGRHDMQKHKSYTNLKMPLIGLLVSINDNPLN